MRPKRRQRAADAETEAALKGTESKVRIGFCTINVRQQLPLFLHGLLKMAVEQDMYVVAVQETAPH